MGCFNGSFLSVPSWSHGLSNDLRQACYALALFGVWTSQWSKVELLRAKILLVQDWHVGFIYLPTEILWAFFFLFCWAKIWGFYFCLSACEYAWRPGWVYIVTSKWCCHVNCHTHKNAWKKISLTSWALSMFSGSFQILQLFSPLLIPQNFHQ